VLLACRLIEPASHELWPVIPALRHTKNPAVCVLVWIVSCQRTIANYDRVGELGHGKARGLPLTYSSNRTSVPLETESRRFA
jgi:hypothetical protein